MHAQKFHFTYGTVPATLSAKAVNIMVSQIFLSDLDPRISNPNKWIRIRMANFLQIRPGPDPNIELFFLIYEKSFMNINY